MRLVSLCPSLTELVFDLGRGPDLVGITEWCVHPAEGVAKVEKVGGTKNPKVARIVELDPDLVLMNDEENRREDADALVAAGVRILSSLPRDCAGTAEMVRSIGDALERPHEAEQIAREIEQRSARVVANAKGRKPMRFAYLIWRKPWMAASGDTFASALLAQAGGENVFASRGERYPEITPEELARAAPDRVFLCTEPFPFEAKHVEELAQLTHLPPDRFVIADGEYLSWHGSRTPAGIDYAERLLR
ncbi:MAG: ABC transporter substrate-binding protein [Planctomycetes bacterium]|nr:ABC transporter substrate-binding protein [Planctomycetota bacterium]